MYSPAGERYGSCEAFPGRVGGVSGWVGDGNGRDGGLHNALRLLGQLFVVLFDQLAIAAGEAFTKRL
jgi:hypothetical protein